MPGQILPLSGRLRHERGTCPGNALKNQDKAGISRLFTIFDHDPGNQMQDRLMSGLVRFFQCAPRAAAFAAIMAAGLACVVVPAQAEDTVSVLLNQARIVRLPEKTKTVIIGNPTIADVTVHKHGNMVLTGKSYGSTNLIAMDDAGNIIAESKVVVNAARDGLVVLNRGGSQLTLSCTPDCEKTLTLGDDAGLFGDISSQVQARNTMAAPTK